jgi:hypothetical protein
VTAGTDVALRDQAAAVLRGNDAGGWTKASPLLYPFTGAPLGSPRQSWTAAVVLDWAAPPP